MAGKAEVILDGGIRRGTQVLKAEIVRDMALMGVRTIGEVTRDRVEFRG